MKPVYFLLKCSSIDDALCDEKILLSNGTKCSIVPTPAKLGDGCGLSIKFCTEDLDIIKAMQSMRQLRSNSKIYSVCIENDSTLIYAENGG